jgi:hypothetical protein
VVGAGRGARLLDVGEASGGPQLSLGGGILSGASIAQAWRCSRLSTSAVRGAPWTDSQAIIAAALSVGGRTLPGIGTTSIARPGPGGRSSVMARRRPRQPSTR